MRVGGFKSPSAYQILENPMNSNKYMNVYMKRRWEKRRKAAIRYLGGGCAKCGLRRGLEFDHINPATKKFTIAKGSSYSEVRFWNEVDKCQLLCKYHHTIKSNKEKAKWQNNGNSKLTNDQVRSIRRYYATGDYTQQSLANFYKVTKTTINYIISVKYIKFIL